MCISRKPFVFVLGVVLVLATAARTAKAGSITYTYTGNDFNVVTGSYTTEDFLSASFTLSSPLPDDLKLNDESGLIESWTMWDGLELDTPFTEAEDTINSFEISTDDTGNITDWLITATTSVAPYTPHLISEWTGAGGTNGDFVEGQNPVPLLAKNVDSPGVWTASPEPSTKALMLTSGVILLFAIRRKHREMKR
jgi:hypothetical protein